MTIAQLNRRAGRRKNIPESELFRNKEKRSP